MNYVCIRTESDEVLLLIPSETETSRAERFDSTSWDDSLSRIPGGGVASCTIESSMIVTCYVGRQNSPW